MPRIKILLVDSNEIIRIYFRDIFWIHGLDETYELLAVQSIAQADKLISDPTTRPSLIFLDLMLPSEEGGKSTSMQASMDFIQKIKQNTELKDMKVVVFTAHSDPVFEEKLKKMGVNGYLRKGESMPKDIIDFTNKQFIS